MRSESVIPTSFPPILQRYLWLLVPVLLLSFRPEPVLAITFDEFDGAQVVQASGGAIPGQSHVAGPQSSAIGGVRHLHTKAGTQSGTVELVVASGQLSHSQTSQLTGESTVIWDGDADTSNVNFSGLGGIDLTQDGATAVALDVVFFDNVGPTDLTVTLYDAGDVSGQRYSEGTLTLNEFVSGTTVTYQINFTDLVAGPGGAADLTDIGAITFHIDGSSKAMDLTLEWIGTNGECRDLPDQNGAVYDQCLVCGGDGTSCLDCEGVVNGPALPGSECQTGLAGVCDQGIYTDVCFCVSTADPLPELCDGIDNDCDGSVDEAFPLLDQRCGSGEGECAIEGTYICDESGGLVCDAVINFDQQFENCGDIIGCDGVPNSDLVEDDCGICGGDGTLCDGCDSSNQSDTLFRLDAGAKLQEDVIKAQTKVLKRLAGSNRRTSQSVLNIRETANRLQIRNWVLSWTLPRIAVVCPVEIANCVTRSNVTTLAEYRLNALELRTLTFKVLRLLKKAGRPRRLRVRARRRAKSIYKENMALADTVPLSQSSCY